MIADEVEVVFRANTNTYIANVTKAEATFSSKVDAMQADAERLGAQLSRVGQQSRRGFADIARDAPRATSAIRGARVETGNLAAQFQDIGVQLAGGASPFTIISQQVPQIVAATGSVRGAIGGLGAALTQLISPVGLVSTAFILAASVAASYFADLLSDGGKSEEQLKKEADLIQKIADKWGDAVPELQKYAAARKRLAESEELEGATNIAIDDAFADARAELASMQVDLVDLIGTLDLIGEKPAKIKKIQDAFAALKKAVDEGRDSTKENNDLQNALADTFSSTSVPAIGKFVNGLKSIADGFDTAADKAKRLREETKKALAEGDFIGPRDPRDPILPGDPRSLQNIPRPPGLRGVDDFGQSLDDMSKAIDGFVERVVSAESGGRANAKNPLSSATGVGQFIASTWADLFRRYMPDRAATMSRSQILAQRNDPEVSRILIRRYAEENAKYLERAGVTITEAALQLAHFLGPRDAARVYNAAPGTPVQGLIGQAAINANRSILGGGATREDVLAYAERRASGTGSGRTREPKKTPAELFEGDIAQVQKRIDLLNAEIEATAGLSKGVEDYGYAVEKAKIKAELLNEAKAKDLAITPELMERIDQLAGNYAKLSAAKQQNIEADRQLKRSQEELARSQEEFANFSKDVLGGFINDLVAGKSAAEALAGALEKIGQKLLDIALDQLFAPTAGGGGGFGGFLASIFGGFKATGGPVSAGKAYIVGEKRPELFVPNTSGKIIPRVPDMASMKSSGGSTGGFIRVTTENRVVNGNLVPDMVQVAGLVAGQQVKQSNKTMAARLQQTQARGTAS